MLKKLFNILVFFSCLSVTCFFVLLVYSKDNTLFIFTKPQRMANGNNILYRWINELVQLESKASNASQEETQMSPTNVTLGPCPDTPPNLLGPIHVEFNSTLTLDEVRKEVGFPLQEGGRYKPPNCTAKQKVAIIIPFRNRHKHLKHWLYYLHPILMHQQLNYRVYVINQDGDGVF
ncbi:beta-1,4-galactosyltransferase 2-like, partial [Plectropomus leopardus]|uniref:beta-1,4-galactosyltransferase 2-like n=1 Tax=Plectropomus leopardus TaxID=160734 RepID=UPI001C4C8C37